MNELLQQIRRISGQGLPNTEFSNHFEMMKMGLDGLGAFDGVQGSVDLGSIFGGGAGGLGGGLGLGGVLNSPIMSAVSAAPAIIGEGIAAFKHTDDYKASYEATYDDDDFTYDLGDDYLEVDQIGRGISQTKSAAKLGTSWGLKGAQIGAAFTPLGAAIGAGVGALAGAITGNLGAKRRERKARERRESLMRQLDKQRSLFNTANTRRDYNREAQELAIMRYTS